ncbi:MAG: bifunctional molybdenum cofactor biosynthesis protein MoaC/MoaB [Sphingobacteriales bacterium]|jgi:cyclic pyranopterin phosphate synthase|nr:bifunctional molybdenum cofactor biosynthesis protein MoaC/MoaB [Sphingobacteriales bacterium]MBP9140221.1 bifunctional molybdenum cofactor biosynthesis protein MoaC/MoaB [Chitinophagales bacterium]MDA0197645.1 bifunctional molybdenum cofactor biosynthesis protein MoaC/MoaB [Bacteroidota bacterium]MBK6888996.1 bifunctional molybdenum cofactor biosynthesis protein MoaC/MoaB [Sphingobacteriales bacterium]MBK7528502.1 bifunctional molybdenum cofactor biosynthesis protein MoaC/MoaB [Sphingobacte
MVNITHKTSTLRVAIAQALVKLSSAATLTAILDKKVPKGDVFEVARVAGLFAAKRTSDLIPDCHPLPIEFTQINYQINPADLIVQIIVEIHTIYKTGVEVEAMHTASVVALTMYDMLKPIDKGIEIQQIKLLEKHGGKSDFNDEEIGKLKAAVMVCSDSISSGKKTDKAGLTIIEKLAKYGIENPDYIIIPDEPEQIKTQVLEFCQQEFHLVVITGGTGLSKRDQTPEALHPLIDREIPGIAEAIRAYGQQRTPYAMLSRSVVGFVGKTLVMALPGSTRGAAESVDAVFPAILHVFSVGKGNQHKQKKT